MKNKNTPIIVIGYQGIGKTTLASNLDNRVIDLESSMFKLGDYRDPYWYLIYCRQAFHIARQGFVVCISSHKEVRSEIVKYKNFDINIVEIYPALYLESEWIDRLRKRYLDDPSSIKNLIAFEHAEENFRKSVIDMRLDDYFDQIELDRMDYDLETILRNYQMDI